MTLTDVMISADSVLVSQLEKTQMLTSRLSGRWWLPPVNIRHEKIFFGIAVSETSGNTLDLIFLQSICTKSNYTKILKNVR